MHQVNVFGQFIVSYEIPIHFQFNDRLFVLYYSNNQGQIGIRRPSVICTHVYHLSCFKVLLAATKIDSYTLKMHRNFIRNYNRSQYINLMHCRLFCTPFTGFKPEEATFFLNLSCARPSIESSLPYSYTRQSQLYQKGWW